MPKPKKTTILARQIRHYNRGVQGGDVPRVFDKRDLFWALIVGFALAALVIFGTSFLYPMCSHP